MKQSITRTHVTLISGCAATVLTGAMLCFTSVRFRPIFADMLGADAELPGITRIALAAKIWCPVLLVAALVVFMRCVTRSPQSGKPLAAIFALNFLVTIFVICGLFVPLRRIIDGMKEPHESTTALEAP